MVTTVVAAMGRHVVAVDPMKEHLSYLHRALELLGNEGNVRLLNNAVRFNNVFIFFLIFLSWFAHKTLMGWLKSWIVLFGFNIIHIFKVFSI